MTVKKEILLIIAGALWSIAGINILRIGISSYIVLFKSEKPYILILAALLSAAIFAGFIAMFSRVIKKNTARILSYPEKKTVFAFLDLKGYLLMAFMMGLGITLRVIDLLPTGFFAVFYTGLGGALTVSGVLFVRNFFVFRRGAGDRDETA